VQFWHLKFRADRYIRTLIEIEPLRTIRVAQEATDNPAGKMWFDDLVVARRYVGPLEAAGGGFP
jgi:hypothetical protein